MKHLVIIGITCCMLFSFSVISQADMIVGARAGYYTWQPFLKDIGASGMNDITWGSGILYGPIFSYMLNDDFTLSISALFGKQSTHWQSEFSYFNDTTRVTGNYYFEGFRADVDSALSYKLSQYFKIFAGYKYQFLQLTYHYTEVRSDSINRNLKEIDVAASDPIPVHSHGPALGIGFNYPLTDVYFFSINVSGLFMIGTMEWKSKNYTWKNDGSYNETKIDNFGKFDLHQLGINVEPVIGMNPGNNLPIVTVGVRYQRVRLQFQNIPKTSGLTDKWLNDTLIGAFVSIMFMF